MENKKTIRDYIILSKLGTGTYGVVYKVVKMNTNMIYVIKQIPFDNLTSKQIYEVKQEAKILSCINSIYVVKYYDSFEENNCINIVMEFCDGGDLSLFLQKHKKTKRLLREDLIWILFLKITIGLAAIHNLKILHRDLKTLNIFLTKDLDVKIGDLGVAKILTNTKFAKTFIGTPYYLSPEICQDIPYNYKSDVWALGCILYELCTYRHPFEAKSQGALILKILRNTPAPIHTNYSSDLQNLIDSLLEKDGEIRPSCYDILTTPNIMDKARTYGLIHEIQNLYPFINNTINYDYYQKNNIYDNSNDNNTYDYYYDGYNNYIYDSNSGHQNNCYYISEGNQNKNYYLDNYKQNNNFVSEYNYLDNENKKQKKIINSNGEEYYIKNNYNNIQYKESSDNRLINNNNNNKNNIINNINKKICLCCIEKEKKEKKEFNNSKDCIINNNNNIVINNVFDKKKEKNKIIISPNFKKHNSEIINENNNNKKDDYNNLNKNKITYLDSKNAIKYIKKPIQNIKDLFRNKSNDKSQKDQKINIEFNNRKDNNNIKKKSSDVIEIKKNENDNKINPKNNEGSNNTQIYNRIINIRSDRKREQKSLDITEFANNLNKYVNISKAKNIEDNKDNKNTNTFTVNNNLADLDVLRSEECPKDNIRNKNKNNENIMVNNGEINAITNSIEDFKIINNNESEKNEKEEIDNKKNNNNSLTISNEIANINSTKINSIIENHKNLKILRNNGGEDKEDQNNKSIEKDTNFEDILYSSSEEKNGNNIYDSEEESDSKSEKVKEIKDKKIRDSSMSQSLMFLTNEEIKKKLTDERDSLQEKIINTKNDMKKLIGEDDYNYIINLYEKVDKKPTEEIYQKIEEFYKDKYKNDGKKIFQQLYFSLIAYDCQLSKKQRQLKKYL